MATIAIILILLPLAAFVLYWFVFCSCVVIGWLSELAPPPTPKRNLDEEHKQQKKAMDEAAIRGAEEILRRRDEAIAEMTKAASALQAERKNFHQ